MAVITPIGTAIKAVARASIRVPSMACTAPPPTIRLVMPRWELVHHVLLSSKAPPLVTTLHRIQTRGTMAIANAVNMATRATWLRRARGRDLWLNPALDAGGLIAFRFESDVTSAAVIRRMPSCD